MVADQAEFVTDQPAGRASRKVVTVTQIGIVNSVGGPAAIIR